MSIPTKYLPAAIEGKWYATWLENKFFQSLPASSSDDKRVPYTIVMPPPNVTGMLHMGHMLNNTIQDVLIRRARMLGKNACWVPGTDHASIATEAKVVALLKERGLTKADLGREKYMEEAFKWKDKYGGIILEQLKKLGISCDWDRTRFTMEESLSEAVRDVFIDLYQKGYIYRGIRMVNWDPAGKTTVSDEEVIHKSVNQKLYYLKYPLTDGSGSVLVATTRPETIMADSAIAIHPDDKRFTYLKGKSVLIPLIGREIPFVEDSYVSMEFGTGCLKVTPAHDLNDYEIGLRHKLPVIDILNDDGTLNEKAVIFVGQDRFKARKNIAIELEEKGFLEKTEDYTTQVGFSERTDAVIEPRLSLQWFMKMKDLSRPALTVVLEGKVALIPGKFINSYKHWLENMHDWCISRQLWWGQQIPAWYNTQGDFVVCKTREEAIKAFGSKGLSSEGIIQDEDVMDTWFSSWLWPISVFDGFKDPNNADISYYYPTDDLVTGPDILFLWVARMIIAGMEYRKEVPFKNVYLTGLIRDKLGRKMSKSLGNSPDPLELMNKFGADAVRMGLLLSSPAGNDLLYDETLIEQGRNFANKIWNAFRLINSWGEGIEESSSSVQPGYCRVAINSFSAILQETLETLPGLFDQYRLSEALMQIYKLIWDDFCSWYLELVKPSFGEKIDASTYHSTLHFFEELMKVLHPYMPFITEELWHALSERRPDQTIMHEHWPTSADQVSAQGEEASFTERVIRPLVSQIRNARKGYSLSEKERLPVLAKNAGLWNKDQTALLEKAGNIELGALGEADQSSAVSVIVEGIEFFIQIGNKIDKEAELLKLQTELEYARGFLKSVEAKLSNDKFVNHAKPGIVENERKKKADSELKISQLLKAIASLKDSM